VDVGFNFQFIPVTEQLDICFTLDVGDKFSSQVPSHEG